MTDAFLRIAERLGVPTAILFLLGVLAVAFVRGPLTRFTELVAKPLVQLVQTAIDFVGKASAALGALPGQIALEGERTRGHVSDRITEAFAELRTERAAAVVPAASQHQEPARPSALPTEPVWMPSQPAASPTSAPASTPVPPITVPEKGPRAPLATLPSVQPPPPASSTAPKSAAA